MRPGRVAVFDDIASTIIGSTAQLQTVGAIRQFVANFGNPIPSKSPEIDEDEDYDSEDYDSNMTWNPQDERGKGLIDVYGDARWRRRQR
jgi:hypothetical protein